MTTLKLLNHSENTPEERMTADVIMRGYANPDELMKKTIEAAKQREKENAAKNARKKKVTYRSRGRAGNDCAGMHTRRRICCQRRGKRAARF